MIKNFLITLALIISGLVSFAQIGGIGFWNRDYSGGSGGALTWQNNCIPTFATNYIIRVDRIEAISTTGVIASGMVSYNSSGTSPFEASFLLPRTFLTTGSTYGADVIVGNKSWYNILYNYSPSHPGASMVSSGQYIQPFPYTDTSVFGYAAHQMYNGGNHPMYRQLGIYTVGNQCTPGTRYRLGLGSGGSVVWWEYNSPVLADVSKVLYKDIGGDSYYFQMNNNYLDAWGVDFRYMKLADGVLSTSFKTTINSIAPGGDYEAVNIHSGFTASPSYLYLNLIAMTDEGSSRTRLGIYRIPINKTLLDASGGVSAELILDWEYHDVSSNAKFFSGDFDGTDVVQFYRIGTVMRVYKINQATKAVVSMAAPAAMSGVHRIRSILYDATTGMFYGTANPSSNQNNIRLFKYQKSNNTLTWIT